MTFVLDLNDTPHLWYRSRALGKSENSGGGGGGGGGCNNVVGIICLLVNRVN